jgi:hypothetical protein
MLLLLSMDISYAFMCKRYHFCGLVVRVPGYRSGGPGFDSRALQEEK